MSRLLILGAGGHGQVVAEAAEATGDWREISFIDDREGCLTANSNWTILGPTSSLSVLRAEYRSIVIAIGDNNRRLAFYRKLQELGFAFPIIIHPRASVSKYAQVGPGTVVFAQAVINVAATIGAVCIVNTGASIDHHCSLEDAVHVAPGAVLAGTVSVGTAALIGLGSAVREGTRIGANAVLGAGAVAVQDIRDGTTATGVPAVAQATVSK